MTSFVRVIAIELLGYFEIGTSNRVRVCWEGFLDNYLVYIHANQLVIPQFSPD